MQLIPVTMLAFASFWLNPSEVEALVGVKGEQDVRQKCIPFQKDQEDISKLWRWAAYHKEWNFKLINPQFEDLFRFDYLSLSTSINTYETVWESL